MNLPDHRRTRAPRSLAAAVAAPAAFAQAQTYPAKPITFVVPFAAGSATDQLARALGQSITEQTKQAVVVDNKAGRERHASPRRRWRRRRADGYTVLITTNTTHAANEHLYKKLPYDPVKDFAPVTGLGKGGQIMVVSADVAVQDASPSSSRGEEEAGQAHLRQRQLVEPRRRRDVQADGDTDILHVPYKSNPLAITDLLGGQIDMMITDTATGVPQIKAGKLRALGVSTQKRSAQLPDVPTIDEAGVKGYDMGYWFAAYVPAGTPPRRGRAAARAAGRRRRRAPAAKTFYDTPASTPWTTTPDELAKFQAAETQKWGKVIKAAGIEPE